MQGRGALPSIPRGPKAQCASHGCDTLANEVRRECAPLAGAIGPQLRIVAHFAPTGVAVFAVCLSASSQLLRACVLGLGTWAVCMIVSAKKLRDAMACVRGFFFGRNQRLDADGDKHASDDRQRRNAHNVDRNHNWHYHEPCHRRAGHCAFRRGAQLRRTAGRYGSN
jgi:hypothetical protein